jgi:hypothetical protein
VRDLGERETGETAREIDHTGSVAFIRVICDQQSNCLGRAFVCFVYFVMATLRGFAGVSFRALSFFSAICLGCLGRGLPTSEELATKKLRGRSSDVAICVAAIAAGKMGWGCERNPGSER